MDGTAQATVGPGHHVFSADDFSERDDAIGSRGLGAARVQRKVLIRQQKILQMASPAGERFIF